MIWDRRMGNQSKNMARKRNHMWFVFSFKPIREILSTLGFLHLGEFSVALFLSSLPPKGGGKKNQMWYTVLQKSVPVVLRQRRSGREDRGLRWLRSKNLPNQQRTVSYVNSQCAAKRHENNISTGSSPGSAYVCQSQPESTAYPYVGY
jgi:hypothetical protein